MNCSAPFSLVHWLTRPRSWALPLLLASACGSSKLPPPAPPAPEPRLSEASPGPDRSRLPEPAAAPSWSAPRPQVLRLSNGIPIYFLQDDSVPLATLSLLLPRGSATDPHARQGLTALMVDLLDEGAGDRDALELSDALLRLATDYRASADVDSVTFTLHALAEHLEPSVALLADIIRRPHLDESEFERLRAQRVAQLTAREADPQHARQVLLRHALFGDGYAGPPTNGTPLSVGALELREVTRHYLELVVPDEAALVLVGAVEPGRAQRALEAAFGGWKGRSQLSSAPLAERAVTSRVYAVDYPGATQSVLAVAKRAPGARDPALFANALFSRSFGGAFTSRVNMNLREDKGYTYGARSGFRRWRDAGMFQITANVHAEVTRESLDEIQRELAQVAADQPITEQEHREAIEGMLLGYPGRFERQQSVARQFVDLSLHSRPLDWYTQWPRLLRGQSLERVRESATRVGGADDYVVIIAGDRARIEAELDGWPDPITWYDAWANPVEP